MIQIKKTILTLALLLTAVGGAWADETLLLTIENKDYPSFTSGSKTFDDKVTVTFSNSVYNDGDDDGWYIEGESLLTVAGINGYTITSCKFYTKNGTAKTGYTIKGESPSVYLSGGYVFTDANKSVNIGNMGIKKIEVYTAAASSASAFDVAWDKDKKTGTFKMPGGNVTLEPEYYPQATLAFKGLTAAEDAAAKTDAPLAVLADGAVTGGTLMYYVATDKNFSQADAIALAETQWSAAIPTAETVEAAGTCYVWYYIKGDAEHSDTDPVPLAVTLLPAPTYAVTFADGTDLNEWTADPNAGVTKGQQVTVTYTGTKKVIGVKAEKKAAEAPAISFSKQAWYEAESAPANFISVSQADAKAAADAEKTKANAPGYVCIYALEGGQYKWIDSHGRTGQHSSIVDIANTSAWNEVYECYNAGDDNSIWFTVEPTN